MSTSSLPELSTDGRVVNDVYFAIMGASGVGKSSFIHLCTGKQDFWANGNSDRSKIQLHTFMLNEHTRINLLDTPGFDDPFLNEAYVLESIAQKLCFDYRQGRYISGMIYLQKITDSLGEGTASLGNLRMFQQLCGSHAYRSLALVTTHWDRGGESGDFREQELTSERHLWGSMAQSIVARHDNTSASARAIITSLLKRTEEIGQITLKLQYEVINDGLLLSETSAGKEVIKYVEMRSRGVKQQLLALPLQVELATEAGDHMLGRELSKLMEQSEAQIKSDKKGLEALKTRI
ncbi:hypothetical protein NA56DRAFT_576953 [Hyaloscypha hepaticicola]|uniref:G domain-containing protein n=1 Tax=Hyaloscypha hepaticicola TaxID=2082293 RepID=A0A2J6PX17_9HELO|nr:hypothetical protein NA56DRAFT_576953 [Hyaloscypha hepaticicola]